MESLGSRIRRIRRRNGLTLDDLSARTGISKPYLSLIETGRVNNPPSDEKLRRLEQVLGFKNSELLAQAHLQRTPEDVRRVLRSLLEGRADPPSEAPRQAPEAVPSAGTTPARNAAPLNLDEALLSGALHELIAETSTKRPDRPLRAVPVVNRVAAGYPREFTDLDFPARVADEYIGAPDSLDANAFACRVHGDSMEPKYLPGDVVIFSPGSSVCDGDDCFVRFRGGQTTFKQVFFEGAPGNEVVRLTARNPKYGAKVIAAGEIEGLYKAVYRYQKL
jgi:transcriptional regulator with XRE-family HTH domain